MDSFSKLSDFSSVIQQHPRKWLMLIQVSMASPLMKMEFSCTKASKPTWLSSGVMPTLLQLLYLLFGRSSQAATICFSHSWSQPLSFQDDGYSKNTLHGMLSYCLTQSKLCFTNRSFLDRWTNILSTSKT